MSTNSIEYITHQIAVCNDNEHLVQLYIERAKMRYQSDQFGAALNDLNLALELEPTNESASTLRLMIQQIVEFSNMDIYNP